MLAAALALFVLISGIEGPPSLVSPCPGVCPDRPSWSILTLTPPDHVDVAEHLGGPIWRVQGPARATGWLNQRRRIRLDTDPFETLQWYLHNDGSRVDLWPAIEAGADINAQSAWTKTLGDPGVRIAVLDTGFPSDHPDLPIEFRAAAVDFIDGDADPSPIGDTVLDAHGTAVAAVAVGRHNEVGVAGVCPQCTLVPMRVLAIDETARDADLVAALLAAIDDADIVLASWSFDPYAYVPPAVHEAIRYGAREGRGGRGTIFVFSAGNRGSAIDPFSPQAMLETLTVAATDERDRRAAYSNTGPAVTLAAPGGVSDDTLNGSRRPRAKIVTADLEGDAGYSPQRDAISAPGIVADAAVTAAFFGTSASAPMVAGAVGLLLSMEPELTANEVGWVLTETAAKVGGMSYELGRNDTLGHGRLDVGAALALVEGGEYCVEAAEQCDNGVDDDCDRRVDAGDPDCGAAIVRAFEVPLGDPCQRDDECGDGFCSFTEGSDLVRYCTALCDFDCPETGTCLGFAGSGQCYPICQSDADCRTGFACAVADPELVPPTREPQRACVPRCRSDEQCGPLTCRDGVCAGATTIVPDPQEGCDCAAGPGASASIVLLLLWTTHLRYRRRRSA